MTAIIGAPGLSLTATELTQGRGGAGVGDVSYDANGNLARFVRAGSNVSQYMWVTIDGSCNTFPLSGSLSAALSVAEIGVATYDNIASGDFGWVVIAGRPLALVGGSCNPAVPIFTTGTPGVLDDATASASNFLVLGVRVHATNGSTGDAPVRVVLNHGATVVIPRAVGHS